MARPNTEDDNGIINFENMYRTAKKALWNTYSAPILSP